MLKDSKDDRARVMYRLLVGLWRRSIVPILVANGVSCLLDTDERNHSRLLNQPKRYYYGVLVLYEQSKSVRNSWGLP